MKKYLLILSALGMGVAQTSSAAVNTISNSVLTYSRANIANSNSYGSSQSIYHTQNSGVHVSNNNGNSRAIRILEQKGKDSKIVPASPIQGKVEVEETYLDENHKVISRKKYQMNIEEYIRAYPKPTPTKSNIKIGDSVIHNTVLNPNTINQNEKTENVNSKLGTAYVPSDYEVSEGIRLNKEAYKQKIAKETKETSERLKNKEMADIKSKMAKLIVERTVKKVFTGSFF